LISGGARGMGAAEARLFAAEGAQVLVTDLLDAEGEALAKELDDGVAYRHHDVTNEDDWTAAVAEATERFGRLDILINNAGILFVAPLVMTSTEEYMRVVEVNQLGVFLGMKAVTAVMTTAGRGSIINISSVAGLNGPAGHVAYAASKWAVRGMTKVAAAELAPFGVRVNSIHPGLIDTPMLEQYTALGIDAGRDLVPAVPLGRLATAGDVARLALYLASDDSEYSTGSEFVVDGGMTGAGSFRRA
ncbi:MAG: 3alpha(or 20beta)-hydroxysteroid dehydrogenase, partial [Acidimicrobiaceae bacterium]|nr:3alpha(or 20beta)-hydroxysteroid dehydrogenase [Acidimicrobiaceae bacterium]